MSNSSNMSTGSVRSYLLLLHLMFGILYGFHLKPPLTGLDVVTLLLLTTLTLLTSTIPRTAIAAPWFISLVAMTDASVLFGWMPDGPAGVGAIAAMFVLLAMVSEDSCKKGEHNGKAEPSFHPLSP